MRVGRWRLPIASARIAARTAALLTWGSAAHSLFAQGVNTAAIHGVVRAEGAGDVDGTRVRVVNQSTGFVVETSVRGGRFTALGLEVGGPYSVVLRRVGFEARSLHGLHLSLGQRLELEVALAPIAVALDPVAVVATGNPAWAPSDAGVGATISDSALRRLPTRNRDLFDFVQLVPQISTRLGISGGGANPRLNGYLLDGVSERALQGNVVAGLGTGGKAISIEAVKEYQVLLSPFHVRYGDFAGALLNAVTRSGTNELHGSAFAYTRSEQFARNTPFLRGSPYERRQFGFAVGGPVVRDRAHFFVASEFQRLTAPTAGPHLGAPSETVPVRVDDVTRFTQILQGYGLDAGSAGRVNGRNPLVNLFGRLDIALPAWRSRLVVRHNYDRVRADRFSRPISTGVFPLSSFGFTQDATKHAASAQLVTHLRRGGANELTVAYMVSGLAGIPYAKGPLLFATVPHSSSTGTATLQAGTHELAQDVDVREVTIQLSDDLTLPLDAQHTAFAGVRLERFDYRVRGVNGSFGRWTFSSLDSLTRGEAETYRLVGDFGTGRAPVRGSQVSVYVGDEWRASDRVTLSAGVRADALLVDGAPAYTPAVDSILGRRTDDFPSPRVQWSPRLAFEWDLRDDRRSRIRGGAGVFVGRPPLAWIGQAFRNTGSGIRTLSCGSRASDSGPPPPFVPDHRNPPTSCANGGGTGAGPVALVARDLRMAESVRASLAYDWMLPWALSATVEGLYTRSLADFQFVNLNLVGPQGVDRRGRVMYGSIDARGRAVPALVAPQVPEIFELRNHSNNSAYQFAGRLGRRISHTLDATAAYAFSRVRDVQSPTAIFPGDAWAGGRTISGRHDRLSAMTSSFEVAHRVVVAATMTSPWTRWPTDLAVYYVGESGSPFTYVDSAGSGMGDLNADGTNANDPIYVPTSAFDPSEIVFSGFSASPGADNSSAAQADRIAAQQAAFDRFIDGSECLRRQRGQIAARNSCRGPWVHTLHASLRQSLAVLNGHTLSAQLEVFNLLNLLNPSWGMYRVPNVVALQQVGQITDPTGPGEPVFSFDPAKRRHGTQNLESGYQLQLAVRYTF